MGVQYRQTVESCKSEKGKSKPAPKPNPVNVKANQNVKPAKADSGKHCRPDESRYEKVRFEGEITRWGKKQQAEVEFVDFIAKNFSGNRVYVYESYKNTDGQYVYTDSKGSIQKAHNGMYVEKNGDIYLDLNAGNHSEGLVLNTFAHELYHHVEKHAPEQAKALAEFIAKELGEENVEAAVNRQIEKARKAGYGESFFEEQGMSAEEARQTVYDRAYSDFIADGLETMFTKGDVVEKLADLYRQDKGLFHTIRKFIRKWVSKLREFYNAGNTLSIEGKQVAELETFDKIQQMFAEALKVAGENFQAQKNTAGSGGVDMFSAKEAEAGAEYAGRDTNGKNKITISMTDSERTEILKGKVITAEVYEGQADAFVEKAEEDLKSQKDNLIKRALIKIGEEFGVFTDYRISDVEVDIRLSRGNIKESVAKIADPIQIAKLLPALKTAVENAVGIECHANRYYYDNNTVMFENLIGGYVEGKHFVPVRLGLRHSMNGSVTLYLIVDQHKIDIKKMKAEVAKAAVMQKHHADDTSHSAFNISLASIVPFVNSKDLLRYLPDNMLTDHQRTAKWEAIADTVKYTNDKNDLHYIKCLQSGNLSGAKQMVQQAAKTAGYTRRFYHGAKKGGGFTKFHSWSYFTENKRYAERYAQRDNPESLYTVYAKMDKPFDTRNADARDLFQQIHDEYGLSDIQESGLPDWTDGYDISDFIDENDLDYDSIVLDEGGDMVDGKPVSRGPSYVVRNSEQVKSADVVTYDDDGNIIPLSWRFNMKNPDIRYSTRDTEYVSNRSLLANALDSVAQDESEKRRLAEYRETIGKLEGYEMELVGLKEQIRELSFGKGPRDMAKIRALKDEAIKTANRIGIYDKKLLRLESTKTLERLLNRETERVRQLEKQRGLDAKKKAVAEARAAGEQKLKDVRAAQKRNVESRHKTQARHEIQKTAGELKKLFARGKDARNVKQEMRDMVAKSMELAEKLFGPGTSDMLRDGVGVAMTADAAQRFREGQELLEQLDVMSTKDPQRPEMMARLRAIKSDLADVFAAEQNRINSTAVPELMDGICNAYQELQHSDKEYIRAAYDPDTLTKLQTIKENLGAVRAVDMDPKQLQELSKALYLNIRNPLQHGNAKVSRDQVRTYLEAIAENEDYSIENCGTYDVDKILQTVIHTMMKQNFVIGSRPPVSGQ